MPYLSTLVWLGTGRMGSWVDRDRVIRRAVAGAYWELYTAAVKEFGQDGDRVSVAMELVEYGQ